MVFCQAILVAEINVKFIGNSFSGVNELAITRQAVIKPENAFAGEGITSP